MPDRPRIPTRFEAWVLLPLYRWKETIMISDFILSMIRTYIPIVVGSALVWLATQTETILDEASTQGVIAVAVALVSGAYYLVARWLESRWPWLSVLLGTPPSVSTPTYQQIEE